MASHPFFTTMKKLLLLLAIVVTASFSAQAQVWIGGNVSGFFNKETQTFAVAPDVGYAFPNTPFSVACAIEYQGSYLNGEGYSHELTVSPYFRYNICDISERFSMFVDLTSDVDVLGFNYFDIGLAPGISFNLTEHWSAEFSYGFVGYLWEKLPDNTIEHSFEMDFKASAAEFGIYYNF